MPAKKKVTASPLKKTAAKKTMAKVSPKKQTPITMVKPKMVAKKTHTATLPKQAISRGFSIQKLNIGIHLVIAGSAIAVLFGLGVIDAGTFATNFTRAEQEVTPATIGLEHGAPVSLSMLFAKKEGAGYVEIRNISPDEVKISLPSDWNRTEVQGTTLEKVTYELPVFGFTRWTIPGRAGVTFSMEKAPEALFFDSKSTATAIMDIKWVTLPEGVMSGKVVLVQKEAEVRLWEEQE